MTLNDLIIEMTTQIMYANKPAAQPYNDFLQDQISEFFSKRASELRVALPNNPYIIKYAPITSINSTNPAINPSIMNNMAYNPTGFQKRVFGRFEIPDLIKKCECGADKLGVMKHSSWCPKHEVENG